MKKRYIELDAIRGIAALMVVLYHYTVKYGQLYGYSVEPVWYLEFGRLGVQLFFIVSGFVIFLTLDKTNYHLDFVILRLSRLYPAYWFAVCLTFLCVYIFTLPGREVGLLDAFVNLSMLQRLFNTPSVDGVYWTLAVELAFYFVMYIIFLFKKLNKIVFISIIWLSIINILIFLETYSIWTVSGLFKMILIFDYANLFISGIMFYRIMNKSENNIFNYMIIIFSLITEFFLHGETVVAILIFDLMFLLFVKGQLSLIAIKPLVFLGTISYSLYLIHQNIGYIIISKLETSNLATSISIIIIPLIISIIIATIMQSFIEKPSLRFIRSKWKNVKEMNQ